MRRFFATTHLWLSIPLGLVISVICLSGASLVFEQEITRALDPQLYRVETPVGVEPLPPSQIAGRIREQVPDSLTLVSIQLPGDPAATCTVGFKQTGRKLLAVDPYTGAVKGWIKSPAFFQTMRKLHRWMMDPPASKGEKSVGKVIVGVSTLLMVVILISGLAIWIPRNYKGLKNRLRVSCKSGWRRFFYDSHVALGFYATLFLLVMALTGLTWSFGWYRTTAYSLFGGGERQVAAAPRVQERRGERGGERKDGSTPTFDYALWDNVLNDLKAQYPVFKTITLTEKNAQIVPDPDAHMRRSDTAEFDPRTGRIGQIVHYRDAPRSQSLRGWFYAFHTGSWGGMTTKILYFLAALIGGILPLTGYYLWLEKVNSRRKR